MVRVVPRPASFGRLLLPLAATGIAYYAAQPDGYHLVATLAAGADATPMRVETTLVADQKVVLSVPQPAGEPALEVQFAHSGEGISVTDLSAPIN